MSAKARSRKRSKKEDFEGDEQSDTEYPEEKKAKLNKASLRKGDLDSFSADSKEILRSDSFEKALTLFDKKDPALSDFIKNCDNSYSLFDVKLSAYQKLVKLLISEKLSTNAAGSIMKSFIGLFLKKGESIDSYDQFKANSLFPKPQIVKETSQEKLRSAGISFRKAGYLIVISEKFSDTSYPLNDAKKLKDMNYCFNLKELAFGLLICFYYFI